MNSSNLSKEYRSGEEIIFEKASEMPISSISLGDMGWNKTGSWRSVRPEIDYHTCIKCMRCWKACPDVSIDIQNEKPVINYEYCKGCGICAKECPVEAITLKRETK